MLGKMLIAIDKIINNDINPTIKFIFLRVSKSVIIYYNVKKINANHLKRFQINNYVYKC